MEMNQKRQFTDWFMKQVNAFGINKISKKTGIPRQTLYDLKSGIWPKPETAKKLGLETVLKTEKEFSSIIEGKL